MGFGGAYRNGVFQDLDGDGHSDIVIGFQAGALDDPIVVIVSDTATTLLRIEQRGQIMTSFRLEQNYPNPFNPNTTIPFTMSAGGQVALVIYDLLGREIVTLFDGIQSAGNYEVKWNGLTAANRTVATGTYLIKLTVGGQTIMRKASFIK